MIFFHFFPKVQLLDSLPSDFDLANFQKILALDILEKQHQGKNQEAREMLEVSWRISQSLKKDGTLVGQLLALRIETFQSGVIRKVDHLSPYWQERLLEHDYRLYTLRFLTINNQRRKQNIEEQFLTTDICLVQKKGFTSELRVPIYMLQLEFTQKILQVKELAKQQGKWPDSFPDLDSEFCPGRQYVYQVSEDGTMAISLDKQPKLVKYRYLPLTYSDRTPPQ